MSLMARKESFLTKKLPPWVFAVLILVVLIIYNFVDSKIKDGFKLTS